MGDQQRLVDADRLHPLADALGRLGIIRVRGVLALDLIGDSRNTILTTIVT
ncbi:hypothetical protein [Natrinema sp. 74]|uniref:hypothetical protein n=1 Tax=Natrinema sp. 74 TaxID=3384159 RepID=UPI0038D4F561